MIEFYPQIKWVHVAAVLSSGALFALRGLALQLGAHWVMAAPLRYLSYTIDTILVTAAVLLATMLHQYPFVHDWLTAKVLLLVCYVVLGSFALERGGTAAVRRWCWLLALCIYGFIISIARARHPLGVFS